MIRYDSDSDWSFHLFGLQVMERIERFYANGNDDSFGYDTEDSFIDDSDAQKVIQHVEDDYLIGLCGVCLIESLPK